MIKTTVEGDIVVAHDRTRGWKIRTPNKSHYGVTPMLAVRQALYVLEQMDKGAASGVEGFDTIHEHVKKMWDGEKFTLPLRWPSLPEDPVVVLDALLDGEEPPTLLHTIFVSVKESTESLDRLTMDDPEVTEQAAGVYLKAMQIQDGVYPERADD